MKTVILVLGVLGLFVVQSQCKSKSKAKLEFSSNVLEMAPEDSTEVILHFRQVKFNESESITLFSQHPNVVHVAPTTIDKNNTGSNINSMTIQVIASQAGYSVIIAKVNKTKPGGASIGLRVFVAKSDVLKFASMIVGWIYAVAWSISFYQKIYDNYIRKNVGELNLDCVVLNVIGFSFYALYNVAMYYFPSIQEEYTSRFAQSIIPVDFSDVIFSIHAIVASMVVTTQCILYRERELKVSNHVKISFVIIIVKFLVGGFLAYEAVIHWLDIVNFASWMALIASLMKFLIQGLMGESKHKSIVGWPIEDIKFVGVHFIGGLCSFLQISIDGFNFNDFNVMVGGLTKILLGLLVMGFDVVTIYKFFQERRTNDQFGYIQHEHPNIINASQENILSPSAINVARRNDPSVIQNPVIINKTNQPRILVD